MTGCVPEYDYLGSEKVYGLTTLAARAQDELGWKLFMEGKIIKAWAHIQELHYRGQKENHPKGKTWATKVVLLLHEIIYKMWKSRNDVLHNNEKAKYMTKEQEMPNNRIHEEFEIGGEELHPDECDVFNHSEEEVKAFAIPTKKRWLDTIDIYCNRAKQKRRCEKTPCFFSAQEEIKYHERSDRLKRAFNSQHRKWWMRCHPHS